MRFKLKELRIGFSDSIVRVPFISLGKSDKELVERLLCCLVYYELCVHLYFQVLRFVSLFIMLSLH